MTILGGVLLTLAAVLMYFGRIFYASIMYILADFVWIYLGYLTGDYTGTAFILIGTLLNIGVFIKMNTGIFVKDLNIKNDIS